MAVRGEEMVDCLAEELDSLRELPKEFQELQETDMGVLGRICKEAGPSSNELFFAAMKMKV